MREWMDGVRPMTCGSTPWPSGSRARAPRLSHRDNACAAATSTRLRDPSLSVLSSPSFVVSLSSSLSLSATFTYRAGYPGTVQGI